MRYGSYGDDGVLSGCLVTYVAIVALGLATSFGFAVVGGWVVMVALGDFHRLYPASVPALGYLTTFLGLWGASFIARLVLGSGTSASSNNPRKNRD